MLVLVTGGLGFIGSHVVDRLVGDGIDVRVLDVLLPAAHRNRSVPQYAHPQAEVLCGDVRDAATVRAALSGVDAVVHHAAMVGLGVDAADLPAYAAHNMLGTAVLLAAMSGAAVRRLVLASSMVVYGEGRYRCARHGEVPAPARLPADLAAGRFEPRCPNCGGELTMAAVSEGAPLDPRNAYAASKVGQEHLAAAWAISIGGAVVALRYHNVYGPRMPRDTPYAGVAAIFRSALTAGRPPWVFEDGGQCRDFVHVADVARANRLALDRVLSLGREAPGPGPASSYEAYNIASGEPHTVGEMASALSEATGGPPPVITAEYRLGDVRHVVADPGRAASALGFRAGVRFRDGMRDFAAAPLRD